MLQPANRLTLIDALRPPAGFGLESAVAVTFTLDLRALLAVPAALTLTGADGIAADGSEQEPIELLHALRSHAGRITVFSQVGEIALPPPRRVFAFLDRAVVPVGAPRGGIVHPKAWVLRYQSSDEPPGGRQPEQRLRVLISSRNLTFDASWDTVVRLDETTAATGASLAPVGDLFEGLLGNAVGEVSEDHRSRVRSLSAALGAARFALPAGVEGLRTHVLGLTETPSPLPTAVERSLIISPFLSDDFFTSVRPAPVGELVSSQESLDALGPTAREAPTAAYVFDDGSAPDLEAEEARTSPQDPGRPLAGLHAKVFAFESEGRARLFVGSANATGPAFNSNVEILVELAGPAETLGIDRLLDGSDDEPGLRRLFCTYHRPDGGYEPPDEPDGSAALARARRRIARLHFKGIVEESGKGWAVTYRSQAPMPAAVGITIHCWPLASPGFRRPVTPGERLEARFETSLENISGFLAFELAHEAGARTGFVVPVPLEGVPEHHERFLLRALIGNAERFFRYLLALLDEDPYQTSLLDAVEGFGKDTDGGGGPGSASLPVLEKLLRTMRRDPAKLAGLHPLVSDLAADDALPPGFTELWETVYDVVHPGASAP